ncbi:MAG: SoxR reducing system RseC family protein [Thiomargarita sp.]|nr:SoxR reducing system RseC family protein [Thiomargarita sp.]
MLKEYGTVITVDKQFAMVRIKRTNACHQCTAEKDCGTASLASILGQRNTEIKAIHYGNINVGDQVAIGIKENIFLKSALLMYLFPLLGLFIGIIVYQLSVKIFNLPNYELLTILAGLIGLFTSLIWVKYISISIAKHPHHQPIIFKD